MPYVLLGFAIAAEVAGTSLLKSTEGFTKLVPTLACVAAYVVAFAMLSRAVMDVPVGVAYAMWSGIGTVAIVSIGIAFLGESLTAVSVVGLVMVVVGVLVLNLGGAH